MVSIFFPKVVQLFNFLFQLFKIYFPIFQVSQADICPESCKRSQIYAGSIPAALEAPILKFSVKCEEREREREGEGEREH